MRIFLSLIICGIVTFNAFSQDYSLFPEGQVSYFKDANNDVFGLVIDKETDENYRDHRFPSMGSWTGKAIIKRAGEFLLTNYKDDTIIVKPYANLFESWIAYKNDDGLIIKATVTKKDKQAFLGIEDSTKTIKFQAINTSGGDIEHVVNNKQIVISKKHGAIIWFNNYLFPKYSLPFSLLELDYKTFSFVRQDSLSCNEFSIIGLETPSKKSDIAIIRYFH